MAGSPLRASTSASSDGGGQSKRVINTKRARMSTGMAGRGAAVEDVDNAHNNDSSTPRGIKRSGSRTDKGKEREVEEVSATRPSNVQKSKVSKRVIPATAGSGLQALQETAGAAGVDRSQVHRARKLTEACLAVQYCYVCGLDARLRGRGEQVNKKNINAEPLIWCRRCGTAGESLTGALYSLSTTKLIA